MIAIEHAAPDDPRVLTLFDELSETLEAITGSSGRASFNPAGVTAEGGCLLLATIGGGAVGCGAFRRLHPGIVEVKRMYARPGTKGVGAALLAALESVAREMGYREAWLETRRVNQQAVRFYERHGYDLIDNFGKYRGRPEAVCFAKRL